MPLSRRNCVHGASMPKACMTCQQGWSDAALLQYSAEAGRVLVTHNIGDFVALHRSYLAESRLHAGIVVTQVRYVGTLLTRLVTLHETIPTEEMNNTLRFI